MGVTIKAAHREALNAVLTPMLELLSWAPPNAKVTGSCSVNRFIVGREMFELAEQVVTANM